MDEELEIDLVTGNVVLQNGTKIHENTILLFGWMDYILFTLMLGLSCLIGIYFGCFGSKNSKTEYLLGDRRMGYVPVSMSLVAAHVSGVTLLGIPAEIYRYGSAYWLYVFVGGFVGIIVSYVYLPVFYKHQVISSYEYLELRFDSKVRMFASFLFALTVVFFLPMVIYIPALAFSQVTGVNLHLISPFVCLICIFYTMIGGIKAVIWTDTLQISVTIVAMIAVFCLGLKSAGGFVKVWNDADHGHRLDILRAEGWKDPDPTVRDSFWAVVIGCTVSWVSYCGTNQSYVQKFLSVPSLKDARKSVVLIVIGIGVVKTLCVFTGFIMFSKYSGCDPLTTGDIQKADQLLPYHVMDVAGDVYGLPGLFVAGVVCASLSTLSAHLNTLAGAIYEDFISPYISKNTSAKTINNILKSIVVIAGVISVGLVFVIEHLGGILSLAYSLSGITAGPLLGLFTLGMLFPSANAKGALYGGIGSLLTLLWIILGTQYYIAYGYIKHFSKPLSTEMCDFYINSTSTTAYQTETHSNDEVFFVYRISFYYYTLIGAVVAIVIGLPVSWLTQDRRGDKVDIDLLSPVVHWMVRRNNSARYHSVEKVLHIITSKEKENFVK